MRVTRVGVVVALVVACAGTALRSDLRAAQQQGDHERIASLVDEIAALRGEAAPGEAELGVLRHAQAEAYWELGRDREAEAALHASREHLERAHGKDALELGPGLQLEARLLRQWKRYDEAAPLLERFVAIREARQATSDGEFGLALYDLARLYDSLEDRPRAEAAFRRSIDVLESAGPEQGEAALQAMVEYARYIRNTGRESEVLELMQRSRRISPDAWKQFR